MKNETQTWNVLDTKTSMVREVLAVSHKTAASQCAAVWFDLLPGESRVFRVWQGDEDHKNVKVTRPQYKVEFVD